MNVMDLFSLKGKTAILTGGAGLYGRQITEALCEAGADVWIASRHLEALEKVAEPLGAHALELDLASEESIDRLIDTVAQKSGRVDILVNNAGISIRECPGTLTEDVWTKVLGINLTAPVFLSQEIAKGWFSSSHEGVILNISSMAGMEPSLDAYSVAKCGLNSMTKGMARIWAANRIRVNALAVGVTIGTELRDTQRAYKPEDNLKCNWIPVGRFAVPDEVAETAVYLISDRAAYMTGSIVECDGAGSIAFGS